jgi:anti-sigma factor ChrR (cupin superfamily)
MAAKRKTQSPAPSRRNQRPGGSIGGPSGPSGVSLTEAEWRERGVLQLKVRISEGARKRLDELREESGFGVAEQIEALIDSAHDEWQEAREKLAAKQARKAARGT